MVFGKTGSFHLPLFSERAVRDDDGGVLDVSVCQSETGQRKKGSNGDLLLCRFGDWAVCDVLSGAVGDGD